MLDGSLVKITLISFRSYCHVFKAFRFSALQSYNVNKVSFHVDLGFLENSRKQYFRVLNFTVLIVINSPGQSQFTVLGVRD